LESVKTLQVKGVENSCNISVFIGIQRGTGILTQTILFLTFHSKKFFLWLALNWPENMAAHSHFHSHLPTITHFLERCQTHTLNQLKPLGLGIVASHKNIWTYTKARKEATSSPSPSSKWTQIPDEPGPRPRNQTGDR